jgi:hypothetical protein
MRRRIPFGVTFICALALTAHPLAAQSAGTDASDRGPGPGFELLQNYPNPFSLSTRIPFTLGDVLFDQGQPAVVTMRIFNVLQQLVAYPTALGHPDGGAVPVNTLEYLSPGSHEAHWDGQDINGRQVPPGIYLVQMTVNGRRQIMKMIVSG